MPLLLQNSHILTNTAKNDLYFDDQRAITLKGMARYGPLSNLKKTLWSEFRIKTIRFREWTLLM